MPNATDYMGPVRDAANDLADRLGDALGFEAGSPERAEINAAFRMFAHAILDAARAESVTCPHAPMA